jgi:WD repeat-containing protein 21A
VDIKTNKFTSIWTNKSDVFYQQWDSTSTLLFNGSRDGCVRTVDVRSPEALYRGTISAELHNTSSVCCIKLLTDENYLLSASIDGMVTRVTLLKH